MKNSIVSVFTILAVIISLVSPLALPIAVQAQTTSSNFCYTFSKNLGEDRYLSSQDAVALTTALTDAGVWTSGALITTYNDAVASAVSGFQEKYASQILTPNGLAYGTGFIGASTRSELNSLYGCSTPTQPAVQSTQCPAGYTCTPINQNPAPVCPAGFTCTPTTPAQPISPIVPNQPTTSTCYNFTNYLQQGSTGHDVVALQTFLIANGFAIPEISSGSVAKGTYDSQTAAAVSQYQTSVGMPATGVVGAITLAKLNSSCGSSPTPTTGTVTVNASCPAGYICTAPGQITMCPSGFTCTATIYNCPNGYSCFTQSQTATTVSNQPTVYCPVNFSCVPISSQYPTLPTASGSATGGSCPTGYNCYPNASATPTPTVTTASITPSQVTISPSHTSKYTFTLGYPSNATDATISVSCPLYVFGDCNTGPGHVLGENSYAFQILDNLSTSTKQVIVIYNVTTPQGNTSAQALVNVLPDQQ